MLCQTACTQCLKPKTDILLQSKQKSVTHSHLLLKRRRRRERCPAAVPLCSIPTVLGSIKHNLLALLRFSTSATSDRSIRRKLTGCFRNKEQTDSDDSYVSFGSNTQICINTTNARHKVNEMHKYTAARSTDGGVGWGDGDEEDAGGGWTLYSQFRIEDVQVAQIVCVVGRAEPGQNQQQQSLHDQRSARFPFFSSSSSPFWTIQPPLLLFPPPPPPPPPPPILRTWPCWPTPPRLPFFSRGALRFELILHFLPSSLSFLPPFVFLSLLLPVRVSSSCLKLVARSSQLQRQSGQLPEVEDVAKEEEAAEAGAAEKSRWCTRGRCKSARRTGRRPMQRWHIWNTIWAVWPVNLLRALPSCKRICARMRVCACQCLSVYERECACVYVRENSAGCDLYCSRNHWGGGVGGVGGGGERMEQTKKRDGRGERYLVLLWLAVPSSHAHPHVHFETHTHMRDYNPCIHPPPPPAQTITREGEDSEHVAFRSLAPPLLRWTVPSAADWSDRSKESAYMCGKKKKEKKRQSMTKTRRQINILRTGGVLLSPSDMNEEDGRKRGGFRISLYWHAAQCRSFSRSLQTQEKR